jgi:LmbE family N-acetylglucosaminyl deacetylase
MAENTADLVAIFDEIRPSLVLTHSYEGGHPDHDAAAASVHAAAHLTEAPFRIVEFASYHAAECGMECERFRDDRTNVWERPLTEEQSRWKRRILDSYASQAKVLSQFPLKKEPLRMAPAYDFTVPPHEGALYYERFPWGVSPAQWRDLARSAFDNMGLPCAC